MRLLTYMYGGTTSKAHEDVPSLYSRPELFGKQLLEYQGRLILIVNTASRCGFARQYDDLEKLHLTYGSQGLVVLGFPSNDFANQEPGSDAEIQTSCRINHGVTFPLMPKASVKGLAMQPIFTYLTLYGPTDLRGRVWWNFEKFLVDPSGRLIGRWRSYVSPGSKSLTQAIERALAGSQKR